MTVQVHEFGSTVEAYDASQTHDEIKDGDVLVAESEKACAVLISAWPTALDAEHAGEAFHAPVDGFAWHAVALLDGEAARDYTTSVAVARERMEGMR